VHDLDALYVNFISGWEMTLETAQLLRRGFARPIYADLHSLFLGRTDDGTRVLQPLPEAGGWFACFDTVQLNEDEFGQLGPDPLAAAAAALAVGCGALIVTLGVRGAVYFEQETDAATHRRTGPIRTARVAVEAPPVVEGDPTGCGDVFGAVTCAQLLRDAPLDAAIREGCRLAARNVTYRGASGLRDHLQGRLTTA
jgi:sugar/nucleoside kinase (ribokinase family)